MSSGTRAMHRSFLNHDKIRDAPYGMMYGLGSGSFEFLKQVIHAWKSKAAPKAAPST